MRKFYEEKTMKYILKNKDIDILEFEIVNKIKTLKGHTEQQVIEQNIEIVNILNVNLLPISLPKTPNNEDLKKWIDNRKLPTHRKYAKKILDSVGIDEKDLMGYINVSLGLSLNDSLWIVPSNKDYQWRDFNLYDNKFSEALKLAAFGINSKNLDGISLSPELTTNGALPKCWNRENEQIFLYKGSSKMNDGADEPYSEFYMAQIADIMAFEHIPYDLKEFQGQIVSSCPIFTNENEGYVPMSICLNENKRKYKGVELINAIYEIYDNDKFDDLMVFDALICNTDRHLGNFGMIIDNNTNKILRPAPIFDNGLSMMTYIGLNEFAQIEKEMLNITGHFNFKFDKQLELFVQPRHISNLEKLTKFEFKKHNEFNLSDEWLELIQKYIQDRAKFALQFAKNKQQNALDDKMAQIDNAITESKKPHIPAHEQVKNMDNQGNTTQQSKKGHYRINPRTGRREFIED